MRRASVLPLLVAALLLSACTAGPRPLPENRDAAWAEARSRLRALDAWQAEGRLAVRTGEDGGQAHFSWRESPGADFTLRLSGPWGQGAARLAGAAGRVRLATGDGRRFSGPDARELLASVYGWDIPVDALRQWLVGLPGPGADYSLDRFGRVTRLEWRDWSLDYRRYRQRDGLDLPALLTARRRDGGIELRIAIDRWRLGDEPAPATDSPVPLFDGG